MQRVGGIHGGEDRLVISQEWDDGLTGSRLMLCGPAPLTAATQRVVFP